MLHILTTNKNVSLFERLFAPILKQYEVSHRFHTAMHTIPLTGGAGGVSEVLLLLGASMIPILHQAAQASKKASLTSLRGKMMMLGAMRTMISYDPSITELDYSKVPEIKWDLMLAIRLLKTGSLKPPVGNYMYVDADTFVTYLEDLLALAEINKDPIPVTLDLETVGTDPYALGAKIVSVQITYEDGKSIVYLHGGAVACVPEVRASLQALCKSPKIKLQGANLKYDVLWLAVHWLIVVQNNTLDTYLIGSLLDENRSNSLNMHAKLYTPLGGYDDEFNAKHDKSRMDLALAEDPAGFLTYAGGDTDACHRVAQVFRHQLLAQKRLANFYVNLLHPASKVFTKMEARGILVDKDRYSELHKEVQAEVITKKQEILSLLPAKLKMKYVDNLSLDRDVIMRDFLFTPNGLNLKPEIFTEKTKEPSCSMEHYELLQMKYPKHEALGKFVDLMGEYGSATKTLSTYIVGFLKHLRSDGRFHPTYYQGMSDTGGTVTGRTSAKEPPYQTIPKHTKWAEALRSVYVPPPGNAILKLDFSQGELRITACVANEPTMLKAYKENKDLHAITAAELMGMSFEQFMALPKKEREEKRFLAKAGNFGLIYGIAPPAFVAYARASYGVTLTLAQAQKTSDTFFALYPKLKPWHALYGEMAKKYLQVENPLGRIRHLPLANSSNGEVRSKQHRQAINSPIQSCLSDMMQLAMVEIDKWKPNLWMFGMTHDEVQMYVPEGQLIETAVSVKAIMENLPLAKFGWNPPIKFTVDAESSLVNLGKCAKLLAA